MSPPCLANVASQTWRDSPELEDLAVAALCAMSGEPAPLDEQPDLDNSEEPHNSSDAANASSRKGELCKGSDSTAEVDGPSEDCSGLRTRLDSVAIALCYAYTGQPWSEEEHKAFLAGLKALGKGSWRQISQQYVPSRTPTQVGYRCLSFAGRS